MRNRSVGAVATVSSVKVCATLARPRGVFVQLLQWVPWWGLPHAAPGCFGTPNTIGFGRTLPPRGEQPFRTPFGEGREINK